MQELTDHFDKLDDKISPKKAIKEAAKHVLKVEKRVAESTHNKYATGKGVKHLKSLPPRGKGGRFYADVGIKGVDGNAWNEVKGLYFVHYGFWHNQYSSKGTKKNRDKGKISGGLYIAGSRWMDKAYDESEDEAYRILERALLERMGTK